MATQSFAEELEKFKQYLRSADNEDAKRPLLYPLFQKLFKDKFKIESSVFGADIYVQGQIIVESKTDFSQWIEGFYQALHYQKKYGLAYNTIMVIANKFVGIWKLNKIPEFAVILAHTSDATKAPSLIGKENARKTQKAERGRIVQSAFYFLQPKDLEGDIFIGAKNLTTESFEILKILRNLDVDRLQINTHNFINSIERLKFFFENPIDAIHAFYTIIAYWDITSTVASNEESGEIRVVGFKGSRISDFILISPRHIKEFKTFVESQYVFTNEGSGLTVDYYFSRFDEVISKIDPEYVKQHGIFFTNNNLSRFALWFAKYHFPGNIDENYIVFDPAGGSGNLVSSWHGKLKHKVISELQPDLLRTIERRMKVDPFHIQTGFTIIPKTKENIGLNFLDRLAKDYLTILKKELDQKNIKLNKPIAFLLNPPYKNTDENAKVRVEKDAQYDIHQSILELTGKDAGKERYLAFLGQILNVSVEQVQEYPELRPIVMIFTPTSWLIPRPTYVPFRKIWDKHFKFHSGFLITSNEFFKLDGRWPVAFTIWNYNKNEVGNENETVVFDLTNIKKADININWNVDYEILNSQMNSILKNSNAITLNSFRGDVRSLLPLIYRKGEYQRQPRNNLYRNLKENEKALKIVSGFPKKDPRHTQRSQPFGFALGTFIGFMDDNTPLRTFQDTCNRFSNKPDRVWFQLRPGFIDINLTKVHSGSPDKYGYCAFDLESSKAIFTWFAISKALNGRYPVWANQYDLWAPIIPTKLESYWHSLCFAFVLSENGCVTTKFQKDDPIENAPEVFVDNPLCPTNNESFWSTTLNNEIIRKEGDRHDLPNKLCEKVRELYGTWNKRYCKGQFLYHVGLETEPYFKFFDYPDFLTPHSGLIQIKKYADRENCDDMLALFKELSNLNKAVKEELYKLLIVDFKYFN